MKTTKLHLLKLEGVAAEGIGSGLIPIVSRRGADRYKSTASATSSRHAIAKNIQSGKLGPEL